jgi:putative endonuclease
LPAGNACKSVSHNGVILDDSIFGDITANRTLPDAQFNGNTPATLNAGIGSRYACPMSPAKHIKIMANINQPEPGADQAAQSPAGKNWWVYMIRCDNDSLYTGISTDPERRFREHLQHPRGAKYFNGRQPLAIVYTESGHTRSSASQREAVIKKLDRSQKLRLIAASQTAPSS